jgi:hypothetical protein
VLEPRGRGVLDAPPSRGMTTEKTRLHDGEDTASHSRGARRPKGCDWRCPRKTKRAQGKPGCPQAPAIVRTKCTRVTARCAGTPGLPCAMVLRLIARSPWSRIPLASIADELTILRSPAGPKNLRQLDTSHGCQNHTPLPSAASSTKTLRPAHVLPAEIPAKAFKRRSSARRSIAHRPKPPLRSRSRPTLPRPSHPAPNVRDDRDTPLSWVRDGGSSRSDLG